MSIEQKELPKSSKKLEIICQVFCALSFFCLYYNDEKTRTNNFWLSLLYLLIFTFIAIIVCLFIQKIYPKIIKNDTIFYLGLGFVMLMYAGALDFNKSNITSSKCTNYKISDKGKRWYEDKIPYISVLIGNSREDIDINQTYWNNVIVGDSVNVCIEKGTFGFDYISIKSNISYVKPY